MGRGGRVAWPPEAHNKKQGRIYYAVQASDADSPAGWLCRLRRSLDGFDTVESGSTMSKYLIWLSGCGTVGSKVPEARLQTTTAPGSDD